MSLSRSIMEGLNTGQASSRVYDRNEWQGYFEGGNVWGIARGGDKPLTLMKCHSYMKPLKGGSWSVADPTT